MKTNAGSLKKGNYILQNGEIWQVVTTSHNFRGRGSASLRAKLKNVRSGNTIDPNFKADEIIEALDIDSVKLQFLYRDGNALHFMDSKTFEQYEVGAELAGNSINYIKENDSLYVLLHDGKPISIRPPQSVKLKVTAAEDAIKGDTATNTKKTVSLETGITAQVPLFIKTGDTIVVNPETGEYVERA